MNDDVESLLRRSFAAVAEAAPVHDDPDLADAAIAGAGRIRRRRRASAAASAASLLVLGAAAIVWQQPWTAPEPHEDGGGSVAGGSTSTSEAQREFALEFVVQNIDGYEIYTENDEVLRIGTEEPWEVFGMAEGYLVLDARGATVIGEDGAIADPVEMGGESSTAVNRGGSEFAVISPNTDYTAEEYQLTSIMDESGSASLSFTTSYDVSLEDWNATTVVFAADLWPVTAGDNGQFLFNDNLDLGLETVAQAGFEAVVLTDNNNPDHICVADLDPVTGTSSVRESCGQADDEDLRAQLIDAARADDATDLLDASVARADAIAYGPETGTHPDLDLTGYQQGTDMWWTDPQGRWEIVGPAGDPGWQLVDWTGDEPVLTELTPPDGAIMPVLDHS